MLQIVIYSRIITCVSDVKRYFYCNYLQKCIIKISLSVRGDGGSRVGEVRAGTTSPMPEHKGFMQVKGHQHWWLAWWLPGG